MTEKMKPNKCDVKKGIWCEDMDRFLDGPEGSSALRWLCLRYTDKPGSSGAVVSFKGTPKKVGEALVNYCPFCGVKLHAHWYRLPIVAQDEKNNASGITIKEAIARSKKQQSEKDKE